MCAVVFQAKQTLETDRLTFLTHCTVIPWSAATGLDCFIWLSNYKQICFEEQGSQIFCNSLRMDIHSQVWQKEFSQIFRVIKLMFGHVKHKHRNLPFQNKIRSMMLEQEA